MASMIQCPYDECRHRFIVHYQKKDELVSCPSCSQSVFADRQALVHLEDGVVPESIPPIIPSYKTTKLELLCVGNVNSGLIHAQVGVKWYEPHPDNLGCRLSILGRWLPVRNYYRKERTNYCWFDIPDGYLCWYHRHAQTKPLVEEKRCFYMKDGNYIDLGEVTERLTFELVEQFYPQYGKWGITIRESELLI